MSLLCIRDQYNLLAEDEPVRHRFNKLTDWWSPQYKHYVSFANLIRVMRLDCISYTIEQVNATAGSVFKCPLPALANQVGANRR